MTGSAHRLGKAIAVGLAQAGFQIAIHYNGSSQAAQETQTELWRICPGHFVLKADLSDVNACRELVAAASRHHGRLDLLVHSASPWHEGPIEAVTPGEWDDVFAVGPRAGFFLAQAAFPHLRENRGAIVLISDVAATQAWPAHVPHAVAKAAVNALVRNLAASMGPWVRVNGVAPGIVLPPPDMPDTQVERLVARTPLATLVRVEDVVGAVTSLVSNRSITGQILAVDAGRGIV